MRHSKCDAEEETVRPQGDTAHGPQRILFGRAFANAPILKAVFKFIEAKLEMTRRVGPGLPALPQAPVVVHPFEVHRIDRVLLALEPVARHLAGDDLLEAIAPGERLPDRQFRHRVRSHIGPQQSRHLAHRIGRARAFLPQRRGGIERVLERLLDAASVLVHQPAMIVAANAGFLDEPVRQVGAPVRTMPAEQAILAAEVVIQNQILSHQPHRFDGVVGKLARAADRMPIAPQQVAHRGAAAHARQHLVPGFFHASNLPRPQPVASLRRAASVGIIQS